MTDLATITMKEWMRLKSLIGESMSLIQIMMSINKAFQYAKGLKDDKVSRLLNKIEDFDFDIFELRSATGGNELVTVINYLMDLNDFHTKLRIVKDKFRKYSIVIQSMYNPIAYHNKTHASDVCQTCYYFLTS